MIDDAAGWHGVQLRHLVALRAVARAGSFSGAAAALGYTQSAVSAQVASLERLTGRRMFERDRGSRSLELTDAGRTLLARTETIVAQLEAARAELTGTTPPGRAAVRVGWFWAVGSSLAARLRRRFERALLHEAGGVDELLALLADGTLDLALVTLPTGDGPYEVRPVGEAPFTVVARRDRHVCEGYAVTLAELAALPLVALDGCRAQASAELALRARGHALSVRHRVASVDAALALVDAGLGAALLPPQPLLAPTLRAIPVERRLPPRVVAAAWHRDVELGRAAQDVVDAAAAALRAPTLRVAG